jgi:hypothetical protein
MDGVRDQGKEQQILNALTQLSIPISSSLLSAILAGMGLADWLAGLGRDITGDGIDVQIANAGHSVVVSTTAVLSPEQVRLEHFAKPYSWIRTAKNGAPPQGTNIFDYEAERQHNSDYYELLKSYQKAGINLRRLPGEQQLELEEKQPRAEWPVAAMINQMGAINSYNKAIERWLACRAIYPDLVSIIWTMCNGQPYAIEDAQRQWEALAKTHGLEKNALMAATQAVNPEQGKGANRAKADALTIGGQESFWLLEYFKFAGLYLAALPRTVQGKKDRKTYVVMPAKDGVSLRWHREVFRDFRREFWASSAIKMDVQAALRYTATMLGQWQAAQQSSGRRRRASDYIDGFAVASFKDLGSAVAVMNVATIRLPDWVDWPEDQQRATLLQQVVVEHQRLTAALDEKKGDEEQLLRDYRDFLSSRDPALSAFFDFTQGYAGHVIRTMSKRLPVRRLGTDNLEVIIMANEERRKDAGMLPLVPILKTEGFRNIANAIRQSTVTPQYYKSKQDDSPYDVRYGLADELRRASRDNHEFIRALSIFLQQYSQENARVQERNRNKSYRKRMLVSTEDFGQIVELVDTYGAPTVANMLIAFGYAYDPKTPEARAAGEGDATGAMTGPTEADTEDDSADSYQA